MRCYNEIITKNRDLTEMRNKNGTEQFQSPDTIYMPLDGLLIMRSVPADFIESICITPFEWVAIERGLVLHRVHKNRYI